MPSVPFAVLIFVCLALSSCAHERLRSGERTRHYLLHVPESAKTSDISTPLLLVFHGTGGSATRMRDNTHLRSEADRLGYVAAFLEGSGVRRTWGNEDSGDLLFVRDLLQELTLELPIDSSRIYAVGFSSGGRFVQRLACDPTIRLAAFASVSATLDRSTASDCTPGHNPSALFLIGSEDPSLETPSSLTVAETLDFWGELNGCSVEPQAPGSPDVSEGASSVQRRAYSGCREGSAVVLYVLAGQGHGWPGPTALPGPTGTVSPGRLIADFFASN